MFSVVILNCARMLMVDATGLLVNEGKMNNYTKNSVKKVGLVSYYN